MHQVFRAGLHEPFFVTFMWSPFLVKSSIRELESRDKHGRMRKGKRLVHYNTSVFLGDDKTIHTLLNEMFGNSQDGLAVMYAEKHWHYRRYEFWDMEKFEWVQRPAVIERQARQTALRALRRFKNLKVIELTTRSNVPMFETTYVLPKSVLNPPVPRKAAHLGSHWCTEMITYAVLAHTLRVASASAI